MFFLTKLNYGLIRIIIVVVFTIILNVKNSNKQKHIVACYPSKH